MKLLIEIPLEFEQHYHSDRFADSLHRLSADAHLLAGNYEQETAIMLIKVFEDAISAADVRPVIHAEWIEDGYYNEPWVCSNCGNPCREIVMGKPRWNYCPRCGARMLEDENV